MKIVKYLFPQGSISPLSSPFNDRALLYYRSLACVLMTANLIFSLCMTSSLLARVIYLTSIGHSFACMYFILTMQYPLFKKYTRKSKSTLKLQHIIEAVFQVGFSLALPITVLFWVVLFPDIIKTHQSISQMINLTTIHAMPIVLLTIDLFLNPFRFHIRRISLIVLLAAGYGVINCLYTLMASNIYPPIDWVSFASYLLMFGAFSLSMVSYGFGNLLYRKWKYGRLPMKKVGLLEGESLVD